MRLHSEQLSKAIGKIINDEMKVICLNLLTQSELIQDRLDVIVVGIIDRVHSIYKQ